MPRSKGVRAPQGRRSMRPRRSGSPAKSEKSPRRSRSQRSGPAPSLPEPQAVDAASPALKGPVGLVPAPPAQADATPEAAGGMPGSDLRVAEQDQGLPEVPPLAGPAAPGGEQGPDSGSGLHPTGAIAEPAAVVERSREPAPALDSAAPAGDALDGAGEAELDRLTSDFFATPPKQEPVEAWQPLAEPMARGARRAMIATGLSFGVSMLGIGVFVLYHQVLMPRPVELGGATLTQELPTIPPIEPQPSQLAPAPPKPAVTPGQASASQDEKTPADAPTATGGSAQPLPTEAAAEPAADAHGSEATPLAGEDPSGRGNAQPAESPGVEEATSMEPTVQVPVPTTPMEADGDYVEMLNAANTLFRRGRHKESLQAYHRALALRPSGAQALSKIAYLELNRGKKDVAKEYATRAVTSDPTNSEGWIVLGASLEAMRDRAGALAAYEKCSQLGTGTYVVECRRLARR